LIIFLACLSALAQQTVDPLTGAVSGTPVPKEEPTTGPDLTKANELVSKRKYAEAEEALEELSAEFPDDPALLLMRGEVLLAMSEPAEALEFLGRGAEVDPDRPRMQFQLGTALASTGEEDAAFEAFGREIANNDEPEVLHLAHLNRSMLLAKKKDWPGAAAELEAVIELQPDKIEVFGDLASLYMEAGELDEASAVLERGAGAGFLSDLHYYSLGARLYRAKRYDESVAALERALEINPGLGRAERSLAACLDKLGREEEALEHLSRYLQLEPDAPDAERVAERIRLAEGN